MSKGTEPYRSGASGGQTPPIVIEHRPGRRWVTRLLFLLLLASAILNVVLYTRYQDYFHTGTGPMERYDSGDKLAEAKIAVIEVTGTIMPPFTERILEAIETAQDDDDVKGVLLVVDSPGGLVADSHEIYHGLTQLRETKPIAVSMRRMAASGGYYISMGAGTEGTIFAEPTTWTGSIGVIIPHYEVHEMAAKIGLEAEPLKTGPYKDALSPFRELTEDERAIWKEIMDESFDQFMQVIDENRAELDRSQVEELATGQIYTAAQAKQGGLIDEIGFKEDAIDSLKQRLGLEEVRVVKYEFQTGLLELLTGTVEARQQQNPWTSLLEATVPRAMYYCSWSPGVSLPR